MDNTTALILPSEASFISELKAINKFQALIRANLKEGTDWGIIPGTKKPSLLKPGAEKTTKLLGLADTYEVIQRVENWDKPFFNYEVKCTLIKIGTDTVISEGLGSCNSWESKYRYRWVFPDDVPQSIDKTKLVKKTGKRRDGKGTYTQYRLDNEDIFSQVNTLLKMAAKRALIDAALHAGRLSELFTQDIEDGAIIDADYTVVGDMAKGKPAESSRDEAEQTEVVTTVEHKATEQSEQSETKIPSTTKELMEWVDSHGKEYTRTWIINKLKIEEERLSADPVGCYHEIKELAAGMKGWED